MNLQDYISLIQTPFLVTVSGSPGSGKSTAAKTITRLFGAERIYIGEIQRKMAAGLGMTLEQFTGRYAVEHPDKTDIAVDNAAALEARQLYTSGKSVLVEGRTQFHFLPESFKLYVGVNAQEGARRIREELLRSGGSQRNEAPVGTLEEMIARVEAREQADANRYLALYGFDHRELCHYDLLVDSSDKNPERTVLEVLHGMYAYQRKSQK